MGKRLLQQRRGKGTGAYRTPSFRYLGKSRYFTKPEEISQLKITDIMHSPGHNAPIMEVKAQNGEKTLVIAPEGVRVGQEITIGQKNEIKSGNIIMLKDIPPGTPIFNIEIRPGDGGKFVRTSGTFAKIVGKTEKGIKIVLPSKKTKIFNEKCKATIGVVAGGGRKERPFYKAGNLFKKMRQKNQLYPVVSGVAKNAVDHPFGGSSSASKGRPNTAPKNAPPGRKVGKIRARRTGLRKKR